MAGKVSEAHKAIALAIRLAEDDDAKSVANGRYKDRFLGPEWRQHDRMANFISSLAGTLQASEPEIASELSAFRRRIIAGEPKA